ncbi:uncharacterized protein B0T15DRAFT_576562 [Chaetomium strumarium]|uniref:Uncharacterized protein n=1 Tax=Chaetomium strumarium TaxID=1170767 RepID=A0AAJ0GNB4_9PEZI|nr:hypothetical protein B0T15DRAFT_576562 [Chaetomium strumarium]
MIMPIADAGSDPGRMKGLAAPHRGSWPEAQGRTITRLNLGRPIIVIVIIIIIIIMMRPAQTTAASRPTSGGAVVVHVVTHSDGVDRPVAEDHPVRHNRGRFVERGGRIVWRKEPRFRGSGTLDVLDDPVRDGRALARTADCLPGDDQCHRGSGRGRGRDLQEGSSVLMMRRMGKAVGRWGGLGGAEEEEEGGEEEEETLRYEEGERDGGFTLGELARLRGEKPAYTVRIVSTKGKRRRDGAKGMESARGGQNVRVETEVPRPAEAVVAGESTVCPQQEIEAQSEVGSETGSESSREDGNSLPDFSCEEADGWVPVMVAEDDESDDWMSLTGSWVWMGEGGEVKDCL